MQRMDLMTYLKGLTPAEREALAKKCDASARSLMNVAYGARACGPVLAANLEVHSKGVVTRRELRPNDWQAIWPELKRKAKAAA